MNNDDVIIEDMEEKEAGRVAAVRIMMDTSCDERLKS